MYIYGAGLAGLLAANMLRRYQPEVYEAQESLPNNHEALLRFRSDAVAKATGIPFRKVLVHKAVMHRGQVLRKATLRHANQYSFKVTGEIGNRSILNLDPVERWIAPTNLVELLARDVNIKFGHPLEHAWSGLTWFPNNQEVGPVISTIPMPKMMELAHVAAMPSFNYRTITSITVDLSYPKMDVYQTVYNPDPNDNWYRASITGSHFIVECVGERVMMGSREIDDILFRAFGIGSSVQLNFQSKIQRYGKIAPIDDEVRRAFILSLSDQYGIYSLGRYATWRNILLDDVVNDVEVIHSFITQRGAYARKLLQSERN